MFFLFLLSYTIADVNINAKYTNPTLIQETSGLSKGNQLKDNDIRQAIYNLAQLRLFNFIAVDTSIIGDGIYLKIIVEEAPFLKGEPQFVGNTKIKNKVLREKIGLRSGQVITDRVISEAENKIIELYREKSFYNNSIHDSLAEDTLNNAKLFFIIKEGIEPRIGKIEFNGNQSFPDHELKRKMANKEKVFLRTGKLDENKLKEDIEKIKSFYKENGFLDIHIDEPIIEIVDNKFIITINLQENKKYYIGAITFKDYTIFDSLQFRQMLKYKIGDIYNLSKIEETLQNFYAAYADEGYIYCNIISNEKVEDSLIAIEYIFKESTPANLNRVIINGNYTTREKVIRREIVSMPGRIFRRSDVVRSQRQIFNLGYFEDIQINTGTPDDSGNIDLIYNVKEKQGIGTVGAGVAYSGVDRFTGYVEYSHPNVFGRGQHIYTKIEAGGRLKNYQIGFTEPWLFDTRTSLGFDIYYTNRLWDYYTKRDIGIASNISFPFLLDFTRFNYVFRTERTHVFDIASTYEPPSSGYSLYDDTIPKWTLANTFGLTRDTRDYIFNPSSGSYITTQAEFAKKFLFANVDYNRFTFEARTYFPIFWKFVFMNRIKMGVVTSADEVPFYKRFYAGGIGDDGVRGYSDRSLSPTEGGREVGGSVILINNIELKLKVSQGFALLLFYDAGNAFKSYRDVNLYNLYRGVGAGVRFEVPMMGVLGLDIGYGLDSDKPGFTPHFQINPFGMF